MEFGIGPVSWLSYMRLYFQEEKRELVGLKFIKWGMKFEMILQVKKIYKISELCWKCTCKLIVVEGPFMFYNLQV